MSTGKILRTFKTFKITNYLLLVMVMINIFDDDHSNTKTISLILVMIVVNMLTLTSFLDRLLKRIDAKGYLLDD